MNAPTHCSDCARLMPIGQETRDPAGYPCCAWCLRAQADRERWAKLRRPAAPQPQEPGDCDLRPEGSLSFTPKHGRRRRGEL